jgi:mannose-6-phosphate isomerase-like protein (cupin superfamily)
MFKLCGPRRCAILLRCGPALPSWSGVHHLQQVSRSEARPYNLTPSQVNRLVDDTVNTQYIILSRSNMQGRNWPYLVLALTAGVCSAQSAPTMAQTKSEHPKDTATFVSSAEIRALLAPAATSAVADNVLRVAPIEGEYNVGVSVVRRIKVNGKTPPDAILHHDITEIYHVLKGSGILITGGTIKGETELPADDPDVRTLIGPSTVGKVITGGTRQRVGPGDVVIIPPNTAHGFVEIISEQISYLLVRVDPHRVLARHDRKP